MVCRVAQEEADSLRMLVSQQEQLMNNLKSQSEQQSALLSGLEASEAGLRADLDACRADVHRRTIELDLLRTSSESQHAESAAALESRHAEAVALEAELSRVRDHAMPRLKIRLDTVTKDLASERQALTEARKALEELEVVKA